ncbi:MAG: pilus assembly protein TadG-related protein [Vicinamibacterales bacterium]
MHPVRADLDAGGIANPRLGHVARLGRDQRGVVFIFAALLSVVMIGMVGLSVDIGYVLSVRQALQASTDAAATAGAGDLGVTGGNPSAKATLYSSVSGNKNARANIPGVSISTTVKCTNFMSNLMTGQNCSSHTTPANTISVTQTANVPLIFLPVMGFRTMTVRTTATSGARGGGVPPLDIMMVLDTTGSMGGNCTAAISGLANPDRLDCAKAGIKALLTSLWPCPQTQANCGAISGGNVANPIDRVGLAVFPGLKASTAVSQEFDCPSNISSGEIAAYSASPVYTIVPLSGDFKTSATGPLNGSVSNLVKAVAWADGNSCTSSSYGAENPGGQGSYFADAITAAQSALVGGRAGVQDVIIFVSDGDANRYTGGPTNPCRRAVTAADAAAATGTWVYAVAYGAASSGGCSDDTAPRITPYATMQGIASDPSKFYSQATSGSLTAIFQQIGQNLLNTRLMDDATP